MNADAINKQCSSKNLLLEEYKFIANELTVSLKESITINMQIALEINYKNKIKVVEIADKETNHYEPLLPYVTECLKRTPLVEIEATLLSQGEISIPNVKIENKLIQHFENVYMILGSNLLQTVEKLNQAFNALTNDGFILSRERLSNCNSYSNMSILTIHSTSSERLVLIKKPECEVAYRTLQICNNFEWIEPLQKMLREDKKVILFSQVQHTGILGFTNCVRREGNNVRCVYVCDEDAPSFSMTKEFYREQLEKGHAVNVLKNGKWGTYRCLPINKQYNIPSQHSIFGSVRKENLQSFSWFTGPVITEVMLNDEKSLVYVSYDINFQKSN